MPVEVLEEDIRSTGFYRNKAKNIRNACEAIVNEHKGKVPRTMAELRELGGVGRKTANVVLGNMWNTPDGVVVDTHVSRISQKLGLTKGGSAEKIEKDLNKIVPAGALDNAPPLADLPRPPRLQGPQARLRQLRPLPVLLRAGLTDLGPRSGPVSAFREQNTPAFTVFCE